MRKLLGRMLGWGVQGPPSPVLKALGPFSFQVAHSHSAVWNITECTFLLELPLVQFPWVFIWETSCLLASLAAPIPPPVWDFRLKGPGWSAWGGREQSLPSFISPPLLTFWPSLDFTQMVRTDMHACSVMSDSLWPPWTVAHQAPRSMGFSRQKYWSGLPFPPPGNLPDPGIKPTSPTLAGGFFTVEPPGMLTGVL